MNLQRWWRWTRWSKKIEKIIASTTISFTITTEVATHYMTTVIACFINTSIFLWNYLIIQESNFFLSLTTSNYLIQLFLPLLISVPKPYVKNIKETDRLHKECPTSHINKNMILYMLQRTLPPHPLPTYNILFPRIMSTRKKINFKSVHNF